MNSITFTIGWFSGRDDKHMRMVFISSSKRKKRSLGGLPSSKLLGPPVFDRIEQSRSSTLVYVGHVVTVWCVLLVCFMIQYPHSTLKQCYILT